MKAFLLSCPVFLMMQLSSIQAGEWSRNSVGTYYWTCPAGVNEVAVRVWGGGGAGAAGNAVRGGGGGGGGGFDKDLHFETTPGRVYTVKVGSGGQGGTAGFSSQFLDPITSEALNAGGGQPGIGIDGGAGGNGGLWNGGFGGNSSQGNSGGGGGGGGPSDNAVGTDGDDNNGATGGAGGLVGGANGGNSGLWGSNAQINGGGGGGAGVGALFGGSGLDGFVKISW